MPPAKTTRKPAGPPPTDDFEFTAPNGEMITLPPMGRALNAAELRKLRKASPIEILYHVIERDHADDPGIFDSALGSMSLEKDMPRLVQEWQEFSRISVGESSAS